MIPYELRDVSGDTLVRFNVTLEIPPDDALATSVSESQAEQTALAVVGGPDTKVESIALAFVAGPSTQPHRNIVCWVVSLSWGGTWPLPWGGLNPNALPRGRPPTVSKLIVLIEASTGQAVERLMIGTVP